MIEMTVHLQIAPLQHTTRPVTDDELEHAVKREFEGTMLWTGTGSQPGHRRVAQIDSVHIADTHHATDGPNRYADA